MLTCYTKAKPRPSKWDDAHKWLPCRAPDGDRGRRRSSGADDRMLLPWASSHKGIGRPSWTWSGDVPAADVGGLLAEGEETKRVVGVSERQIRCVPPKLRDVGTEMTPAGSKEPSRTNTPRARIPAASPKRRDGGSRGSGAAVDLDAARESAEGRDPAARARPMAVSPATAWGEAERAKHIAR